MNGGTLDQPTLPRGLLSGSLTRGESQYWTYIVENAAGKFYIGSTDDLDRRDAQLARFRDGPRE